ncbi:MAG: ABC transporter ATP-binding protein, partial [Halobacteriaceae archaeon]
MTDDISRRTQLRALWDAVRERPTLMGTVFLFSSLAALLEGIGISYLLPIIDLADSGGSGTDNVILDIFRGIYSFANVPLTLETVIAGVMLVMTVRYMMSFGVEWTKAIIRTEHIVKLQSETFENALAARVSYFDEAGADEVVNTIVTQTKYTGEL